MLNYHKKLSKKRKDKVGYKIKNGKRIPINNFKIETFLCLLKNHMHSCFYEKCACKLADKAYELYHKKKENKLEDPTYIMKLLKYLIETYLKEENNNDISFRIVATIFYFEVLKKFKKGFNLLSEIKWEEMDLNLDI